MSREVDARASENPKLKTIAEMRETRCVWRIGQTTLQIMSLPHMLVGMSSHACSSLAVPGGVSSTVGELRRAHLSATGQFRRNRCARVFRSRAKTRLEPFAPSPARALPETTPVSQSSQYSYPSVVCAFLLRAASGNFLRGDAPSPDHSPRRRLQDNGQILWRHRQGRQGCANRPAARSIRDPASRLRQRRTRPSSPPGSFVVYLRKYLSGRAPALTFPDPARLRTKPDADVLTGGLSYDHKFSVSGKPKDELVRTPRARVHPGPRPSISANPRVMPTRQPPARAPPSGIRDHPTPRPLLPLH